MSIPVLRRRLLACAATLVALLVLPAAPAAAGPTLDLERLDGPTAIKMMEQGRLTSVQLTRAYIERIEALNKSGPGLNAVTQLNPEALADAARLDRMRDQGEVLSPAHGLPILLKDLIDVEGMYTSAGNFSLRSSFPGTDSGVAKKLRENGVVILGKTGLSEYANSFGSQPSGFGNLTGQVLNANDTAQSPSGSSSGTGTAGGAALSMLTIGTETSGSILSPSGAQSLVGLRPTVGLVPGYGVAPIRLSQDTAGPMDRTVANAALTLTAIAGGDPINDAYYEQYWGPGIDPADVVPPLPDELPDYMSALDLDFVEGKRIGYNGTSAEVMEAKEVLEEAGAILVERPTINPGSLPALPGQGEQHMAIDRYYERLGPDAPIKSLAEEIADNQANEHEALKFGHNSHLNASNVEWGFDTPWYEQFSSILPVRKQIAWSGIERMLANDTPDDPSDDFIAILGSVPNGPLAGYPAIRIPMGYTESTRRATFVSVNGTAYSERDLLGIAYVIEQGTKKRIAPSELNPSMYRCARTTPRPPYAERGACNPDYKSLAQFARTAPELPFALETESVEDLEERLAAGTLTSAELTRAYLARIAVANAQGPAIQAVREVNTGAVGDANRLDAERKRGKVRGPLHGIPVLLDDGIDAKGLPSTGGSIALQGSKPVRDSTIAAKLADAGAIILGKANVSELNGIFSSNMPDGYSSLGGKVLLPADTIKPTPGSSTGAAAATASGMAAMAVGIETSTDTAQLIAPAGVNGVVGLKPTVGRVSRNGVMPVARSQDSPGPIAQTVADAAAQLGAIAGEDRADPGTADAPPVPDYLAGLDPDALAGKRVAVVASSAGPYPDVVAALDRLGTTTVVKTVGTPAPNPPSIVGREFERDLDAYLAGLRGPGAGSLAEIIAYNQAHEVEGLKFGQDELVEAESVDLSDPATKAAYEADLEAGRASSQALIDEILDNGTPGDPDDDFDVIVVPSGDSLVGIADRAGYPVLTVPAGFGTGNQGRNPIGVNFVAGAFAEDELLAAGYAYEQATKVRLAPSWTNPSMWRCVAGSEFFSPHHCHPGDLLFDAGP
ncbi:MAG TPA: amidase family protein [Solirubrobacterales bacterium]|nr:amidase family protein [Solirubrobacterales bacterium]